MREVLSPFSVLLIIYVVYIGVVYSSIYKYAYLQLMNMGSRIMGFRPGALTLALYLYGAAAAVFGLLGGVMLARRTDPTTGVAQAGGAAHGGASGHP
jgi:predicted MFS family arabinose efflux permease